MKKGFTLIELLVVIALLAIIATIATPAINSIIKNSNNTLYEAQIKSIEEAASNFTLDYYSSVNEIETFTIELNLIKRLAYIEESVINIKTNEAFSNDSLITFTKQTSNYDVEFHLVSDEATATTDEYKSYVVLLIGSNLYEGSVGDINNVLVFDKSGNEVVATVTTTTSASTKNAGYTTVVYSFTLNDEDYSISRDEKE